MTAQRPALGRGLGALLPGAAASSSTSAPEAPADAAVATGVAELPVAAIDPNPEQPRRIFDPEQLAQLADSIQRHGVLQPVVVRRAGERYELIVGERRWRASQVAGRETLPAVVSDSEPRDRLELAIVENVQRHDLNPIELAHAFRALADVGHTQDEIGRRVGLDRSSVANHLRLLDLPRELQEDVEAARLSMGHAKALLQVSNPERRRHLRDRAIAEGLSVRQTEQLGRAIAGPAPARRKQQPRTPDAAPELAPLQEALRQRLQTQVRLHGDGTRGRIEIEYFGLEDLERLTSLLLGRSI
ncbi:MAG: ParB/RepB/Spo0J family partition protein [Proteobacteria bacterium]|nr:ParB/RepB/Spo0J family partition protein [Pseudomonadota bacterium]